MAKQKHKNNAKPLVLITIVIIALIVLLSLLTKMQEDKVKQPIRVSEQPSLINQPMLGNENAPVTMVEFGDYKCPSCKAWGERIFPQLKQDYIDKGKVKFAFINTLFHGQESTLASLAAESVYAQDADMFWTYHQAIFDAQPAAEKHDDQWVTPEKLMDLAQVNAPQINLSQLVEDLIAQTYLPELNIDMALVEQYKVQLTPTIMINGIIVEDPFDYKKIKSIIDREIGDVN